MRTKSMILGAAVLAAGVATSMAQSNVYSVNVVGYVTQVYTNTINNGSGQFSVVSNPLDSGTNTLGTVLPSVPNFANFYKWNAGTSSFQIATFVFGNWDHPEYTLNPGEAGFIFMSSTFTNTFVGTVKQGSLTNHLNAGFTMTSSQIPLAGTADSLGVTASMGNFDTLYKWNFASQSYDIYTLVFGGWSGPVAGSPVIGVGESFFTDLASAANWTTNFTVQ